MKVGQPSALFAGFSNGGKRILQYSREHPLGRRVLTAIILCSTCLAFFTTSVQLILDYRHDVSAIEVRVSEIEYSYLLGIASSVWNVNDDQTEKQLEGIVKLPDVLFVQLKDPKGKILMQKGTPTYDKFKTFTREMPLIFIKEPSKTKVVLGTITVTATLERIYASLYNKVLIIFGTQTVKTTIVAIFTLFIFSRLVSRHLSVFAAYARKLDINNPSDTLVLPRPFRKQPDELDMVASAINQMAGSIKHDFDELDKYRAELEKSVASRTDELAKKISEMEDVIQKLNTEITERELAERTVQENEIRYRQLVEMSPDAIMIEREERIIFANNSTLQLLGAHDSGQILGMPLSGFFAPEWHGIMHEHMQNLLTNDGTFRSFEGKIIRVDGTALDVEITHALFQHAGLPAVQTVVHDITHYKHYEQQLRRQALHDGLTGLPNRLLLIDRLEQAIEVAERQKHDVYVLFFDLDRFKCINDTLGHDAGDDLLKIIAQRILEVVRKSDTLARLGGDEFVLVLDSVTNESATLNLIQRLINKITEPCMLGNQEVSITCSIGISICPHDGKDASTLIKHADVAMYRAKEQGRNGIQRYHEDMRGHVNEHLLMATRLRHALENQEFLLHYQPLLSLRTGKIVGAEALIRWQHPELGLVSPARFIPLAEETGMIIDIGEWVILHACAQAQMWQNAGLCPVRVAVNLSAQQLVRPHLEADIQHALQNSGLAPEYLEVEITESMSMKDPRQTVALLHKLRAMGIHVAIDDFGTGYSNMAYLQRFPVGRLKLDRSFVCNISQNDDDATLAKAIIGMAHSLDLIVVAEGVEEIEQLTQLVSFGCDEMQGYYFSPPVPSDVFLQMLSEGKCLDL